MRRSFLAAQGTDFGQKLGLCSSNSDAPSSSWHQATHSHIPEPPEGNCLGPTPRSKALGAITISEACLGCITQQEENPNSGGTIQPGSLYSCVGDPHPSRRVQQGLGQLLKHNGDRGGFPTAPAPEGFGCRNIFPHSFSMRGGRSLEQFGLAQQLSPASAQAALPWSLNSKAPTAPSCHLQ